MSASGSADLDPHISSLRFQVQQAPELPWRDTALVGGIFHSSGRSEGVASHRYLGGGISLFWT